MQANLSKSFLLSADPEYRGRLICQFCEFYFLCWKEVDEKRDILERINRPLVSSFFNLAISISAADGSTFSTPVYTPVFFYSTKGYLRANCDYLLNISQKLKTRVIKKSTNPEWNDELTLSIEDPAVPVRLVWYIFALFPSPLFLVPHTQKSYSACLFLLCIYSLKLYRYSLQLKKEKRN